jgi:hypothetical protein
MPARFVTVAKANGKERELAILTVRDRVAQRATLDAIEPLFEPHFLDCNFAFRPDRSVEMAIQRMIAARANGYWWTVESDVENFFGSIDRKLLLDEIAITLVDQDVLWLLNLWLEAGALDPQSHQSGSGLIHKGRETLANLQLFLKETASESLDEFIAQRFAVSQTGLDQFASPFPSTGPFDEGSAKHHARREALKLFLKDGALLALSHRAVIAKALGLKLLGAGGLVVTAALTAPRIARAYRQYFQRELGTLQGAPVSPLLTNVYMTPFDAAITKEGWRLIRYCDDFVIQCRTETECRDALCAAEKSLAGRRLRLHPDKTRIVPPTGEFEFLGYVFASDGHVVPPPTVPEQIAQKIRTMAHHATKLRRRASTRKQCHPST